MQGTVPPTRTASEVTWRFVASEGHANVSGLLVLPIGAFAAPKAEIVVILRTDRVSG